MLASCIVKMLYLFFLLCIKFPVQLHMLFASPLANTLKDSPHIFTSVNFNQSAPPCTTCSLDVLMKLAKRHILQRTLTVVIVEFIHRANVLFCNIILR